MPPDLSSSLNPSLGSSVGSLLGNQSSSSGFPQQARLEDQTRVPLQQYSFPKPPQQPMLRHRPNPYADVPSLYDLYAQYSKHSPKLERFGEDVFVNGTGNLDELPMDLPAGPDYVVGPGDGLTVNLTGGISQRLQRVVDREGRIELPEVGAVEVSGRSLADVQHLVQTVLRGQFRGVDADVSLSRIRTVRVYVTGDVERPGAYDVSSLSTPLNALYIAGGPTSGGSLRIIRHYRGKQLIQDVDIYDLLLHSAYAGICRELRSGRHHPDSAAEGPGHDRGNGTTVSESSVKRAKKVWQKSWNLREVFCLLARCDTWMLSAWKTTRAAPCCGSTFQRRIAMPA